VDQVLHGQIWAVEEEIRAGTMRAVKIRAGEIRARKIRAGGPLPQHPLTISSMSPTLKRAHTKKLRSTYRSTQL
jgi:hypothetical protein